MPNVRVTFLCYLVIKSEHISSFSITIPAIQACYEVRTHCFSKFMTIQQTSMVHANIHFHTKAYHMVQTIIHFHTKAYCMTHTNIHCAHQNILHGTYEHSFFTPRHITWYIRMYILHSKVYCIAHVKLSYCIPVYKTRLNLEVCHLCIRFLLSVLSISLMRVARNL